MSEITDFVTYEKFRKVADSLSHLDPEAHISFEYIMTAFFPTIYNNVISTIKDSYTKGYIAGLNENQRNNI